jgi:hypothetical protein
MDAGPPALKEAVTRLVQQLEHAFPGLPNPRWIALRLLDGDDRIIEAVRTGELGQLAEPATERGPTNGTSSCPTEAGAASGRSP